MKRLNDFLEKAPLWQVYIFMVVLAMIVSSLIWLIMGEGIYILMKISLFLSIILGAMFTLTISLARQSSEFWRLANILESDIDEAEDKNTLNELWLDFLELKRKASVAPHYAELRRLKAIVETKMKYVK